MRSLLGALVLLLAPAALAGEGRQYAILSLIGDRLLIVTHDMATGSRIDRNQRTFVDLEDATLDDRTAIAIDDALKRSGAVPAMLLSMRDPRIYRLQRDLLDASGDVTPLFPDLRQRLGEVKATHLVLVTKHRHDSMLRLAEGNVGSGKLEGLGFYIDHAFKTVRGDTGEHGRGFLAPFAYFRLTLVELPDWKVVREERVLGSIVRSAARSNSGHPWDAMSATAKVNALQGIIRREVMEAVPKLVAE